MESSTTHCTSPTVAPERWIARFSRQILSISSLTPWVKTTDRIERRLSFFAELVMVWSYSPAFAPFPLIRCWRKASTSRINVLAGFYCWYQAKGRVSRTYLRQGIGRTRRSSKEAMVKGTAAKEWAYETVSKSDSCKMMILTTVSTHPVATSPPLSQHSSISRIPRFECPRVVLGHRCTEGVDCFLPGRPVPTVLSRLGP